MVKQRKGCVFDNKVSPNAKYGSKRAVEKDERHFFWVKDYASALMASLILVSNSSKSSGLSSKSAFTASRP